jgi:hypothetical protein
LKSQKILFIGGFVLSSFSFADVDYSHCMKQLNRNVMPDKLCSSADQKKDPEKCGMKPNKSIGTSYFPFELLNDGKIKPHPAFSYKLEGNNEELTLDQDGVLNKLTIKRNSKNEIVELVNNLKMKSSAAGPDIPFINVAQTKFENLNGKCIPSRLDSTSSIGNESRQDVFYETRLCRNLQQFFKKNPDAQSCFDKGYIKQVQNIFSDYYTRNGDVYGVQAVKNLDLAKPFPMKTKFNQNPGTSELPMPFETSFTNQRLLAPSVPTIDSNLLLNSNQFATSPVTSANIINMNCNDIRFTGFLSEVISDEDVWVKTSAPAAAKSDDETVVK